MSVFFGIYIYYFSSYLERKYHIHVFESEVEAVISARV